MKILLTLLVLVGCSGSGINSSPSILSTGPYKQVRYLAEAPKHLRKVDDITFLGRGQMANIMNTIPGLYKKAIEYKNRSKSVTNRKNLVFLTNVKIQSFAKLEDFPVEYQDCKTVYVGKNVPVQDCKSQYDYSSKRSTYRCNTVYRYQTVQERKCETKTRIEKRWVLYQLAKAEVYR